LQEEFLSQTYKISQVSKMLDALSSNTDGVHWTDTCVPSRKLNSTPTQLICNKLAFHHLENSDLQEVCLRKTDSFLTGKHMLDAAASNIDGFLCRETRVSSTQ
jgi:hypothetical protein